MTSTKIGDFAPVSVTKLGQPSLPLTVLTSFMGGPQGAHGGLDLEGGERGARRRPSHGQATQGRYSMGI